MASEYSTIQAAVDAISRGDVIIVVDAEDRENEGDFICAAEKATPEVVNFILTGRGEFCVPVLPEVCERLELRPIVESNTAPLSTAFMTPIDHRSVKQWKTYCSDLSTSSLSSFRCSPTGSSWTPSSQSCWTPISPNRSMRTS